jgi:hypothetical protein
MPRDFVPCIYREQVLESRLLDRGAFSCDVSYPTLKLLGFLLPGFRPWASSRPRPEERSSLGVLTFAYKVGLPPRSHPLEKVYLVFCALCKADVGSAHGELATRQQGIGVPPTRN